MGPHYNNKPDGGDGDELKEGAAAAEADFSNDDHAASRGGALEGSGCVVETGLAEEMNALSVEERERVYDEIHGVASIREETPELVSTSLEKMREELAEMPRRTKAILDRAIFTKPSIARDDKFHMMFLRASRFDPHEAAYKMCRFFLHKLKLFGAEKLVREITLDDLEEQELRFMYDGSIQFHIVNARGMRAEYIMLSAYYHDTGEVCNCEAWMRYQFYQLMTVLEDEEVQKRGIVEVHNFCGKATSISRRAMLDCATKGKDLFNDRPVRVCGFHTLFDQSSFVRFLSTCSKMMMPDLRLRQRFHFGSKKEIQSSLLTYGISLPEPFFKRLGEEEGIFARRHIESYLEERRQKEAAECMRLEQEALASEPNRTPCATQADVLMGRGLPYQRWVGNKGLARFVEDNVDRYISATAKNEKTAIASEIVQLIKVERGGKFLMRTDTHWEAIDDMAAREKVSQLFRAATRSRLSQVASRITTSSSIGLNADEQLTEEDKSEQNDGVLHLLAFGDEEQQEVRGVLVLAERAPAAAATDLQHHSTAAHDPTRAATGSRLRQVPLVTTSSSSGLNDDEQEQTTEEDEYLVHLLAPARPPGVQQQEQQKEGVTRAPAAADLHNHSPPNDDPTYGGMQSKRRRVED